MIEVVSNLTSKIDLIKMKNDKLEITVSNFGCHIISVLMKDGNDNVDDVVLGYDEIKDYQNNNGYLGALVGRVANRIAGGKFTLNNQEYTLAINNGPNHLHGGIKGFSYQVFDYVIEDDKIIFSYLSKDNEEGYPGNLTLSVTYTLTDDMLIINYYGVSDQDTLINLTNHSYFNLSGTKENIYNHQLKIKADTFACIDANGLPTGQFRDVKGSPFDFNQQVLIKDVINQDDEQLIIGKGYDHPFIFTTKENQVELIHQKTKRKLTVSTSLPGAQIYSANYLDGKKGKNGAIYHARDGICIETQNLPDAIHLEANPTTILRKGEIYDQTTSYKFEVIK